MGTVSIVRNVDLGEPQRKYIVEPKELPVPMPTKREDTSPVAEPVPVERETEKV